MEASSAPGKRGRSITVMVVMRTCWCIAAVSDLTLGPGLEDVLHLDI